MCYSVGVQIASASRHVPMKPEMLCGRDSTHPSGGRSVQLNDWRFVVFLPQRWMKSWEVTVARLKLEETPLLDKVFICCSPLSFLQSWRWRSLVPRQPCETDFSYGPAELSLRRRVHGAVFQPDAFHSFPGLITARDMVEDIFSNLIVRIFPLASKVAKTNLHTALCQLQPYWVKHTTKGLPGFSQGPQWRSQMRRGRTLATQFRQRITGF